MRNSQHGLGGELVLAPEVTTCCIITEALVRRRADGERRLPPQAREFLGKLGIKDLDLSPHFYKCPQTRSRVHFFPAVSLL